MNGFPVVWWVFWMVLGLALFASVIVFVRRQSRSSDQDWPQPAPLERDLPP